MVKDEYYWNKHEVAVGLRDYYRPRAEVTAYTYPDGMPKNELTSNELREVAKMMLHAADELEKLESDYVEAVNRH